MRFFSVGPGSLYFELGPVLHKALETGVQLKYRGDGGFDAYWRCMTRGDHAGLTFHVQLWGMFFEFTVHDVRHWDWDKSEWCEPEVFTGYPHE